MAAGRVSTPFQDPSGPAQDAELHADHDLVAVPAAECFAQQQLVVPHAVEVAGVEEVQPGVERGVDRRDALGLVGRSVEVGHAHQAEPERRDVGTGGAEGA